MITEFGKMLRKMRIDSGELLRDMAEKMKMTSSYLSAIEIGKRPVPGDFVQRLQNAYNLEKETVELLKGAIVESAKQIKIDLGSADDSRKSLAYSFARKFDSFSKEDIVKLKKMIDRLE